MCEGGAVWCVRVGQSVVVRVGQCYDVRESSGV